MMMMMTSFYYSDKGDHHPGFRLLWSSPLIVFLGLFWVRVIVAVSVILLISDSEQDRARMVEGGNSDNTIVGGATTGGRSSFLRPRRLLKETDDTSYVLHMLDFNHNLWVSNSLSETILRFHSPASMTQQLSSKQQQAENDDWIISRVEDPNNNNDDTELLQEENPLLDELLKRKATEKKHSKHPDDLLLEKIFMASTRPPKQKVQVQQQQQQQATDKSVQIEGPKIEVDKATESKEVESDLSGKEKISVELGTNMPDKLDMNALSKSGMNTPKEMDMNMPKELDTNQSNEKEVKHQNPIRSDLDVGISAHQTPVLSSSQGTENHANINNTDEGAVNDTSGTNVDNEKGDGHESDISKDEGGPLSNTVPPQQPLSNNQQQMENPVPLIA